MSSLPIVPPRNTAARLLAFAIETHPPLVYTLVAGGWSLSLLMLLCGLAGARLPATAPWLGVVFFLALLYLRAVDEIKDLPYDRLHHPGRPLVRGAVSVGEVAWFAAGVGAAVLAVCAWLSLALALLAAGQLVYAWGLMALERAWRRFRESILLNLCLTFPVSAVLNLEAFAYLAGQGAAPPLAQAGPVLVLHMAAFLHMEFGRKLKWPQQVQAGENGYAQALGVRGAVAACLAFGVAACALASWVLSQRGAWALLPWLSLLPSVWGLREFWRNRKRDRPRELKPLFGAAMLLFFWLNALAAL
ncbi:UbiA family prenyltransferase [Sphaerotilaceae bacterium SBD11-9]